MNKLSNVENKKELRKKKAEKIAKEFFELLWTKGNRSALATAIVQQIMRTHPNTQSGFWLVVQMIAGSYTSMPDGFFDLRNGDAREFARMIADAVYVPAP